ncbi:precorrin-6A reductase [Picrophilus oshimae]|uniref:Precorrin-6X reductase n=1 Tax=Picrophilus torridus (strain ATCC 700027 / DSM 9790 / JCM 10055 / NBRC 100828 / KAW 2/3) TaxID=1122961 RepID=Q6L2V5_PICTO|nr:precorrin-6A reductase [Picrophilus oshimae]AAT42697.1 precorrin-6X reductase [Picrophilus oshimae DSM 9789]
MRRIYIINGTSDSRFIIKRLRHDNYIISSAVTDEGIKKLSDLGIDAVKGPLDINEMMNLLREKNIDLIIDASHPFAYSISRTAMTASEELGIDYIRYERPSILYESTSTFSSYDEIADCLNRMKCRALITTGIKNIDYIKNVIDKKNIIIRVLPRPENIERLINIGIPEKNIIAMEGPFTYELELAIMNNYNIECLVTKDNGDIEKIKAALEKGIKILILKRDNMEYKNVYNDINEIIKVVYNVKSRGNLQEKP